MLQSHQVHLTMLQTYACIQYTVIHNTQMNISTVKWAQWDKTQSTELLGLFIRVCITLHTIVAHNIAQNRPDNFPSYPPDNHHCSNDVMMSTWGKEALYRTGDMTRRKQWCPSVGIGQASRQLQTRNQCYVHPCSGRIFEVLAGGKCSRLSSIVTMQKPTDGHYTDGH